LDESCGAVELEWGTFYNAGTALAVLELSVADGRAEDAAVLPGKDFLHRPDKRIFCRCPSIAGGSSDHQFRW
jgi:hypothetical protein